MNAASSRSHCMFTLSVQQVQPGAQTEMQAEGKLTLVDLAGSERQQALLELHKAAMQDSVDINKSLFTLRKARGRPPSRRLPPLAVPRLRLPTRTPPFHLAPLCCRQQPSRPAPRALPLG